MTSQPPAGAGLANAATALVDASAVPAFLRPLVTRTLGGPLPGILSRVTGGSPGARRSAVLMLMGEGRYGPDLLLTQRAATMRTHPGQPAFPGGALDPGEDAVAAALREGMEETGVDPNSVLPVLLMPQLYVPVSEFAVQPVLGFWHSPGPVAAVDPAETAAVARVPVSDLVDPANRVWVRIGDYRGPGFEVAQMLVWGFTGMLVDALLELGGWAEPWQSDRTRTVEMIRP